MRINISLCPTNFDGLNADAVFCALMEFLEERYPKASIEIQVGHRQGDEWFCIDGVEDVDLRDEVLGEFDLNDECFGEERP